MRTSLRERAEELEVKLTRGQQKAATQRAAKVFTEEHARFPDKFGGEYVYNAGHHADLVIVDAAIAVEIICGGTNQQRRHWSTLREQGLV